MPELFLYGQTIHPIELVIQGPYRLIVFQLYPSAVKQLLELNPRDYTDSCFDLSGLSGYQTHPCIELLKAEKSIDKQVEILSAFLSRIAASRKKNIDEKIQSAISLIISSKGNMSVTEVRTKLHITERTFERQFVAQVGVSPKQFAKIIQFQNSLTQLNENDFNKLTDIVYENGFVDQSHFIKSFKEFTGTTPKKFQKRKG